MCIKKKSSHMVTKQSINATLLLCHKSAEGPVPPTDPFCFWRAIYIHVLTLQFSQLPCASLQMSLTKVKFMYPFLTPLSGGVSDLSRRSDGLLSRPTVSSLQLR